MSTSTTNTSHFIIPEGATAEEQWSWREIERMCQRGDLTPKAKLFRPESKDWVLLGEADPTLEFGRVGPADDGDQLSEEELERLEEAYAEGLDSVRTGGPDIHTLLDLANLAHERRDRSAVRKHLQDALDFAPFDARVATEVKKRFSAGECRSFRYLDREPAPWDDFSDMAGFVLEAGWVTLAALFAACFVAWYVPFGAVFVGGITLGWGIGAVGTAARKSRVPVGRDYQDDWLGAAVMPLVTSLVSLTLLVGAFVGIAALMALIESKNESAALYAAGSPIMVVLFVLAVLAIMPAIVVRAGASRWRITALEPLGLVRSYRVLGGEYWVSVLLLTGLVAVATGANFALGWIPIAGPLVVAAVATVTILAGVHVLARLLHRHQHLL